MPSGLSAAPPVPAQPSGPGRWAVPLLLALALLLTGALAAWHMASMHRSVLDERLEAVGRLRQERVSNWLTGRLRETEFLANSPLWAELYSRPTQAGEPAPADRLLARAMAVVDNNRDLGALVFDAQGQLQAARPAAGEAGAPPALQAVVRQALAEQRVLLSGPYSLGSAQAAPVLDLVLPLKRLSGPQGAVVVLRLDFGANLAPYLRDWAAPGVVGRSLLWYDLGQPRLALEAGAAGQPVLLHRADASALQRAVNQRALGRRAAGEVQQAEGPDGAASLALLAPVPGTGWWLEVALDRQLALQSLRQNQAVLAGGLLLLLLAMIGLLRQQAARQALQHAQAMNRSQAERLDTLALLEAVVEHSEDAIVAKDLRGRYSLFNRAAQQQVGRPSADVLGHLPTVFYPPATAGPIMDTDAQVLATGQTLRVEERHLRPDGREVVMDTTKGPLRDASGRITGLFAVARDITEQAFLRQAQAELMVTLEERVAQRTQALQDSNTALATAERFIRAVGDQLPGRVAYWDKDTVCRYANKGWFAWYGFTPEQALGQPAAALRGHVPADQHAEGLLLAALAGQAQHVERISWRDRRRYVHQLHYLPDLHQGTVVGTVVMAIDITALKDAETELVRARDAAEAASRAKSAFLANMSHEIRTPLNAVIGLAHLLQRDLTDPQQRGRLQRLSESAQHLLQLINDVLDLSKIEAGKLALEHTDFGVEALMVRACEIVGDRARSKGLELVLDTDHLPQRLSGDPTRLLQALLNLLSNAVKFTERGWVRLRGELLSERDGRVQVKFEVADSGIGIAPKDQARLFQPFEQADGSTTRRFGGTGLGLALTRHLAGLMEGEMGLHSQPGAGSSFWFTAWFGQAGADGAPAPAPLPPAAVHQVLLVDDLPEARLVLRERLQMLGLAVQAVDSGEAALAHVRALLAAEAMPAVPGASATPWPDVLLVDWRMPGLDGIETLLQLKALLGPRLPPSLMVTAQDDASLRGQALAAGYAAVLAKPVSPSSLQDALRPLLGGPPAPASALAPTHTVDLDRDLLRLQHAGQCVLVVDDHPVNREVARALLEAAGLQVQEAEDGAQALALLGQWPGGVAGAPAAAPTPSASPDARLATRLDSGAEAGTEAGTEASPRPGAPPGRLPDLVLMDLQMPGMDGLTAARAVRALRGRELPMLAMTAHAFGEDRAASLAAGLDDHLAKPVDPGRLYAALLRWLPAKPRPATAKPAGQVLANAPATSALPAAGPAVASAPQAAGLPPLGAAPASAWLQALQAVPGLNAAQLLARLGDDAALVQRVLARFCSQYQDGLAGWAQHLDNGPALQQLAHGLYGAAVTIEAQAVASAARRLEHAGRDLARPGGPAAWPGDATPPVGADPATRAAALARLQAELAPLLAALQGLPAADTGLPPGGPAAAP